MAAIFGKCSDSVVSIWTWLRIFSGARGARSPGSPGSGDARTPQRGIVPLPISDPAPHRARGHGTRHTRAHTHAQHTHSTRAMFSPTLDLAAPEIAAFLGRKEELNNLISRLRDALRLRETETKVPEGYYKFTSGFVKLLMGLYEGQTKKLREQEGLNLRMRNGGSEEFSVYYEVYEKQSKLLNETVENLNNQLTRHLVGMEELMKLKKDLALVKHGLIVTFVQKCSSPI